MTSFSREARSGTAWGFYALLLYVLCVMPVHAQSSHDKIWLFGAGHTVRFNASGPPLAGGIPEYPGQEYVLHNGPVKGQVAVTDSFGQLLFFVQLQEVNTYQADAYILSKSKVYDRNGNPFPNGNIKSSYLYGNAYGQEMDPLVVPVPNSDTRYYVFYTHYYGLSYSIVDMSLNNGLGDVDPNWKDVPVTVNGQVVGRKITAMPGCESIWLVFRSRGPNAYWSLRIDAQGVDTVPVVSNVGQAHFNDYMYVKANDAAMFAVEEGGLLRGNRQGTLLAAATQVGLELYDFDPCSGKLHHARFLDTVTTFGACFSALGGKLYATEIGGPYPFRGRLVQYDLEAGDWGAIRASKTLVMENVLAAGAYNGKVTGLMGDIKLGPDNKAYVAGNVQFLSPPPYIPIWPQPLVERQTLHVIHQPDSVGMACAPEMDYVLLGGDKQLRPGMSLSHGIAFASFGGTTILPGTLDSITVCFGKEWELSLKDSIACPVWDDGSTATTRKVSASGMYWANYRVGCALRTDSFWVDFVALPKVKQAYRGCQGEIKISLDWDNGASYSLRLEKVGNGIVQAIKADRGHTFQGLDSGAYRLAINNGSCDTLIEIRLTAYPSPVLIANPTDTMIRYGDTVALSVKGALYYVWWPSAAVDTPTSATPLAYPKESTRFWVMGLNEWGCRDSVQVSIGVVPNPACFVPNAFSPNGDGLNDVFKVECSLSQKLILFKIFNRAGQEIYNGTNLSQGWDGNFGGRPCDVGTYFYYIKLAFPGGDVRTYKGELQLLR